MSDSLFSGNQPVLIAERRQDRIAREIYDAIREAERLSGVCDEIKKRIELLAIARRASAKIRERGKWKRARHFVYALGPVGYLDSWWGRVLR